MNRQALLDRERDVLWEHRAHGARGRVPRPQRVAQWLRALLAASPAGAGGTALGRRRRAACTALAPRAS
eukprot:5854623-Pyramimonas_sp.AAC.1